MAVYALSDPHLCLGRSRSMKHLGENWQGHIEKIETRWKATVEKDDIVLVAGDISWGESFNEANPDLILLDSLPGRKILLRGNHDLWWDMLEPPADNKYPSLHFLRGEPLFLDKIIITGVPLYVFPEIRWNLHAPNFDMVEIDKSGNVRSGFDNREKQHEQIAALESALNKMPEPDGRKRIVMVHYPPVGPDRKSTHVSRLIAEHDADYCVFGHLHRVSPEMAVGGQIDGTEYILSAADYVNFRPRLICEV